MSVSNFFFFKFLKKNSATALIPSAFLFLYLTLSFAISIQFLLSRSNRVLPRLLKFFHSVILDDYTNELHWVFDLASSKPSSSCSPRHPAAALPQVQQHLLEGQPHLARKRVMVTNQFHSNTLLSSLQRAELTLMSLSYPHGTLRNSLASLQPLLYGSGTSELMFHKVETKPEGKLPCWQCNWAAPS